MRVIECNPYFFRKMTAIKTRKNVKMLTIDFTFRELEVFCKVVELESFSKAGEAVLLAQASVSERIATLEKKIGVRLLDRLGRKVIPTAAGELLHKHATLLLEMKESARVEIESFLGLTTGEIAMGGSTIPGEYILPSLIGMVRAALEPAGRRRGNEITPGAVSISPASVHTA